MTDNPKAHGDPFGDEEVAATKRIMGLPADETFWVPDDVLAYYRRAIGRGQEERREWERRVEARTDDKERWDALWHNRGAGEWQAMLPTWSPSDDPIATRKSVNVALNAIAPAFPGLVSGSADLTGNTGTKLDGAERQSREHPEGRQIAYGVREHAMGSIMMGMSLHGGAIPIGGTFFVFSDYMRGAVRVAALSEAKLVWFWTHDSIGLGQDGPTHQPIEQLAAMRAMPGLRVIRPADANESAQALRIALEQDGPTALILSRQNLPVLEGTAERAAAGVERGAYVLIEGGDDPDVVLIGTGSEVSLCVEAAGILAGEDIVARVVSMPSWDLFEHQDDDYQDLVLGPGAPVLSVEAASSFGWARWADDSVAIDHFGASAPGSTVLREFGFTGEHVAERAQALLDELDEDVFSDDDE
jgi:transketolase